MAINYQKLFEAFTTDDSGMDPGMRFQFGGGVVNNCTRMGYATMVAIVGCAAALSSHPMTLLIVVGAILFAFLCYLFGNLFFAHKHPDLALMGGATLLKYRHLELAARDPEIMHYNTRTSPVMEAGERTDG